RRHTILVSDWSSDVCSFRSQHLAAEAGHMDLEAGEILRRLDLPGEPAAQAHAGIAGEEGLHPELFRQLVPDRLRALLTDPAVHQIGRASCRERGERSRSTRP